MHIGDIELVAVNDGDGKLPSTYVSGADWDAHAGLLDADGNFDIALACFLISSGGKNILVDAGLGPVTFPPFRGGDLPANLAANGVGATDVDLVFLTHLHVDHIGWLVQDGAPYFPNATVRFGERELDQFIRAENPDPFAKPVIDVLDAAGRIETIDRDEEVAPGVSAVATPGHTLGHTCLLVSAGTERAFVLGDVVTCPAQVENADWAALSDIDPELATRSREAMFRELEASGALSAPSHFPDLRFGRVLRGEGKRYFS